MIITTLVGRHVSFFASLAEQLSRQPKDDQERQLIENQKAMLRATFMRMAGRLPDGKPGPAKIVAF